MSEVGAVKLIEDIKDQHQPLKSMTEEYTGILGP